MSDGMLELEPGEHARARHQVVGWLELFYDLVLVAAVVAFSNAVSHDLGAERVLTVLAAFAAVWWIWIETTTVSNRFGDGSAAHRALVVVQMPLLALVALAVADESETHATLVSLGLAGLLLDLALMHLRHARARTPLGRFAANRLRHDLVAAALLALATIPVAPLRIACWSLAAAVALAPSLSYRFGRAPGEPPLGEQHLLERMGLLTIIVIGESFVKVALAVTDGSLAEIDAVVMTFLFVLVFGIWWAYFDDVPKAGLPAAPGPLRAWIVLHFVLHVGIVGVAIGIARFLPLELGRAIADETVFVVVTPLAIAYLALAGIGACSRRRPVGYLAALRLGTAVAVLGVGIAGWLVPPMTVEQTIAALSIVSVVQAALESALRRRTQVTRSGSTSRRAAGTPFPRRVPPTRSPRR